jgi:hypothetical protein
MEKTKQKSAPSKAWLKAMIKDEEEGIKKYSGKKGFSKQVKDEKSHLAKLQAQLKKVKN